MADKGKEKGTILGNVRKCNGCKHECLPAVLPNDQYVLVRAESNWYWDKHVMASWEESKSVLSHATPNRSGHSCS